MGFPGGSINKESTCKAGGMGSIPWRRAWQPTPVFLPGESPWTEEAGGLQSMGSQRVRHNWATKTSDTMNKWWEQIISCVFNRIQDPTCLKSWCRSISLNVEGLCLENPLDRGAWWATVHEVDKSLTRLKWLSTAQYRGIYLSAQGFSSWSNISITFSLC